MVVIVQNEVEFEQELRRSHPPEDRVILRLVDGSLKIFVPRAGVFRVPAPRVVSQEGGSL